MRSAIGYRLLLDGDKVGALNLFSDTPGGLTSKSADVGAVIASFASVALMAIRAREEAATLRQGLQSNREIGKAVGLLMAAHHISGQEAFELLRSTSQELNMKLAHVASQVIEGQESQFGPRRWPPRRRPAPRSDRQSCRRPSRALPGLPPHEHVRRGGHRWHCVRGVPVTVGGRHGRLRR